MANIISDLYSYLEPSKHYIDIAAIKLNNLQ